jgi:hypothetical protein
VLCKGNLSNRHAFEKQSTEPPGLVNESAAIAIPAAYEALHSR